MKEKLKGLEPGDLVRFTDRNGLILNKGDILEILSVEVRHDCKSDLIEFVGDDSGFWNGILETFEYVPGQIAKFDN